MLANIITEIALLFFHYFGDKAVDKTISLKKWFVIAYCLCFAVLFSLIFCYRDYQLAWKDILTILFGPLAFALFVRILAKWEIERKAKKTL